MRRRLLTLDQLNQDIKNYLQQLISNQLICLTSLMKHTLDLVQENNIPAQLCSINDTTG